jgi:hypothetical protein
MQSLLQELQALNDRNWRIFCDAGVRAARQRFRAQYPINVVCFKCMDGRINLARMTNTPMGLIYPFRNLGGVFSVGWPLLSDQLCTIVQNSIADGRTNLLFVTYHYSRSKKEWGCLGMDYSIEKGKENAIRFVHELEKVFGSGHEQVDIVMLGIETDDDELIFHGRDEQKSFSTPKLMEGGQDSAVGLLRELYPDMAPKTVAYILQLVEGNFAHIGELHRNPREPASLHHTERILALGPSCFDWIHLPGFAVIVNTNDPMLDVATGKAAGIIIQNRNEGRIPQDNALLLAAVGYREQGFHYNAAKEQAAYLGRTGMEFVRRFHRESDGFFHPVVSVVDMYRRKLEILSVNGASA